MRDLVLTTIRGLTDPEAVPLKPDRPVAIGRAGALKIHDELVSIHHARVFFDEASERWMVRDLDSSSGTFVDGECVRDDVRPIRSGTELRFGNVVVRVESASRSMWRALAALAIAGGLLVVSGLCCLGLVRGGADDTLVVTAPAQVRAPQRPTTDQVEVPPEWLRRHGLPWSVTVDAVTDYDHDDASELWLHVGDRLAVVTIGADGRWIDLGRMPLPAAPSESPGGQFPLLEAGGETWQFDPAVREYRPIKQDGIVVWYREEKPTRPAPAPAGGKAKAEKGSHPPPAPAPATPPRSLFGEVPLKVARLPLKDAEQLGQFFVDRSIYGQVHYVICEGAFEGIRAQAVTTDNLVYVPSPGCIDGLRLDPTSAKGITGRPYAIALSPAGQRALIDDVTTFYAGDPSGLFLSSEDAARIKVFSQIPAKQNATRLLAGDGQVVIADPFPPGDARLPEAPRTLETAGRMYTAAPPSTTVTVSEPGATDVTFQERTFRVVATDAFAIRVEEVVAGTPKDVCRAAPRSDALCPLGGVTVKIDAELYQSVTVDQIRRIRVGFRGQ